MNTLILPPFLANELPVSLQMKYLQAYFGGVRTTRSGIV